MSFLIPILVKQLLKLATGEVISQLFIIVGRAWSGETVNKYDDEAVEVIAGGLGIESHPLKTRLKEQQAAE